MADWFKFYNHWLDDPKIQFAISEHPQVLSVLLLLLSEASRLRKDAVPWSDKDYELFAYSRKLNVTVPIINECINLLCRVEFISKRNGSIKILNWNKLQSEYCRGKERGYYKKKNESTSESLASISLESSTRGEESRSEKIKGGKEAPMFDSVKVKIMEDLREEAKRVKNAHYNSFGMGGQWDSDDAKKRYTSLVNDANAIQAALRQKACVAA